MKALYERAAKASYANCLELVQEANILYDKSRYSRAYALCVLAAEEFSKSFLYKCFSAGLIMDPEFKRDLARHDEKVFHTVHLMVTSYLFSKHLKVLTSAMEHDRNERDHSKHVLPRTLKNLMISDISNGTTDNVLKIFKDAHSLKLKALYVDVKDNNVIVPSETIKVETCKEILDFLNTFAYGFDIILGEDDRQFREVVRWVDPQIYSGTMKSDFTLYKDHERKGSLTGTNPVKD